MREILGVVLCLAASPLFAQPSGRGVIAGTVVESANAEPVRKAIVTVTWHGTPRSWATTRTDGDGKFRFDGLPAGVYDLKANKAQLGSALYGANNSRETGENITLADGETRPGLKLRFFHSATLTGHVFGPDGEPLQNLQVQLLRSGRNLGQRVLTTNRQGRVDEHGEYQITDIQPGQYYLYANQGNRGMIMVMNGQDDAIPDQSIVVGQFLGGAHESKDATVLNLHDGDTLKGLDFHLTSEAAVRVKGHILGLPEPPPSPPAPQTPQKKIGVMNRGLMRANGPFVQVSMTAESEISNVQFRGGGGAGPPNYDFNLQPEPTGRYRIQASVQIDGKAYTASELIDVQPGMSEVTLTLAPPVEVKGHLKIEGDAGNAKLNVQLTPRARGIGAGMMARAGNIAADGSFTLPSAPPGEVSLTVTP